MENSYFYGNYLITLELSMTPSHLGKDLNLTQQDFIFDNTALEVKTLSGRERNSVRISSEDQLDSLNDRLFLKSISTH